MIEHDAVRHSGWRTAFVLAIAGSALYAGARSALPIVAVSVEQARQGIEMVSAEMFSTNDEYTGVSAKIGGAAMRCFSQYEAAGISRIVPPGDPDVTRLVVYRLQGNEAITQNIDAVEQCITDNSGYTVEVVAAGSIG